MPTDAEVDPTTARSNQVDAMWRELEEKLERYEQDKADFAREFGFEFEQYIAYYSKQAKEAAATADDKTKVDLEHQRQKLQAEFEAELAQAKARHESQKAVDTKPGPDRLRRIRNRV